MWKNLILVSAFLSSFAVYSNDHSSSKLSKVLAEEAGYSLSIKANLGERDGKLSFLSPAGSPITIPADTVRGKPYLIATFPAGFSPGNDPAIDYKWGEIGDDLSFSLTTSASYKNGPYDAVLIVYVNTPISEEIRNGDPMYAPAPVKGDLSSFTIDDSVVLGDDPSLPNGLVRLNVKDGDTGIEIANRIPLTNNGDDVFKAMTNTFLILP